MSPPTTTPLDFFDRIYVINLPERTDRRREMERELVRVGLPLTPGKVEIFPAIRPADKAGFPSIGACGCFRSHLSIFKLALQHNARNVLMIEDDLTIADQFRDPFDDIARQLESSRWDLAYFGHVLATPQAAAVKLAPVAPDQKLLTTHFYAANGSILPRLIDFLEQMQQRRPGDPRGGPMHVDGALSTFRRQNPDVVTVVAQPNLGFQRSSRSDIAQLRWVDRYPGARQLASAARALARKLGRR